MYHSGYTHTIRVCTAQHSTAQHSTGCTHLVKQTYQRQPP
jgi:hypothetical protein